MTKMVRCLEGHAFDMDASATCPQCGSPVWRDAVKEAAEQAAREAREAKEAKAAQEAAERTEKAKAAKAVKEAAEQTTVSPDGAQDNDVVARAARAARDDREAKAARKAAERIEAEERRVLAAKAAKARSADLSPDAHNAAGKADRSGGGVAPSSASKPDAATAGVTGAGAQGRGAQQEAPPWVNFLIVFVGLPALLYVAFLQVPSWQVVRIYQEYGKNQPDNTALENVSYTVLLELKHAFHARVTDVPYGPNAGRVGRDGLVSIDQTGEPTATATRRVPLSAIRDPVSRPALVSPETPPRTIPNPFATPNR